MGPKPDPKKGKEPKEEAPKPCAPPSPEAAKGAKKDSPPPPEDDYAAKLDMCLTDGVVKTGSGVLLGAATSVLFFRRRRWPIIAGMGMGIGLAWANCEHAINPPNSKALQAKSEPAPDPKAKGKK